MTTPEKKNEQRTFHTFIRPSTILNTPISSQGLKESLLFNSRSGYASPPPSYLNICMGAPPFTIWILPQKNAYTKYTEML